jgi:hypothetical protein
MITVPKSSQNIFSFSHCVIDLSPEITCNPTELWRYIYPLRSQICEQSFAWTTDDDITSFIIQFQSFFLNTSCILDQRA